MGYGLPMGHELVDVALVLIAVGLAAIALWATVYPQSSAATWIGWASRRVGGPRRLVVVVLSGILFIAVAEDVLWQDSGDWVTVLDHRADAMGREIGRDPVIREVARAISLATGVGLVAALAIAGAALVLRGRRRAAVIVLVGTAGACLVDMAFKVAFRVPRPRRSAAAVYGFPSGHTFVTLIAVGLLAFVCSRGMSRRRQLAMYAAGLAVALVTGASRIVLQAHWLSDVVGALALGSLYLAAATTVSAHDRPSEAPSDLR